MGDRIESRSSRDIAFQLLREMEAEEHTGTSAAAAQQRARQQQLPRRGAVDAAVRQQEGSLRSTVRAHPLPLAPLGPAASVGSATLQPPASLQEQHSSDDTLDQDASPFQAAQPQSALVDAVDELPTSGSGGFGGGALLTAAGSGGLPTQRSGKPVRGVPSNKLAGNPSGSTTADTALMSDTNTEAAADAAAAEAAGRGGGGNIGGGDIAAAAAAAAPRHRRRLIPLRRVVRDAYEYHGLNELGLFFIFAMITNVVLYFHWTSTTATFKNTVQYSFQSYGNPDWQKQTLLGVDTMMDGVEYISGWLQFWIQRAQTVGEWFAFCGKASTVLSLKTGAALSLDTLDPHLSCTAPPTNPPKNRLAALIVRPPR